MASGLTLTNSAGGTLTLEYTGTDNSAKTIVLPDRAGTTGVGQMLGTAPVKAISYNAQTINESIVIPADVNFSMVGTVTLGTGYTITVSTGARGVVL